MNQLSSQSDDKIEQEINNHLQLLVNNPDDAETCAKLGYLYIQQENWLAGIKYYQQAIEINPEFVSIHRNLARIFTHLGKEEQAAEYWFKALTLEPNWAKPEEHYNLGNVLLSQKKLGKAIVCYRQTVDLEPNFIEAYYHWGECLTTQENLEAAAVVYRRGIKNNPNCSQLYSLLGKILAHLQNWEQAIANYRKAIELEPNLAFNYLELAKILKTLQKHLPLVDTYLNLGSIFQKQGQYEQAIVNYDLAIKNAPNGSDLEEKAFRNYCSILNNNSQSTAKDYYSLAKCYRSKSRFAEAINTYKKAIELDPYFHNAYIDIQYTKADKEQLEALVIFYQQILEKHPNIPVAWGNLGDVFTEQGKLTEAIDCYQKCCYKQATLSRPALAKLDWKEKKENAPDFIIFGAAKCGTTSLFNYLSYHPQIIFPHKKELDFFGKNFDRGVEWYLSQFPAITDNPEFITGEATPNYIRSIKVAQRISQLFAQIKLILLLRNPIDRAVSWHYHKINSGLTQGTIEAAIDRELEQIQNFTESEIIRIGYYNPDNILSSLYFYKIREWMKYFSPEQFLILKSEDLYEQPAIIVKQVQEFLGLPEHQMSKYPIVNAGSYPPINDTLRNKLANYFQPHNQKLETFLGVKFNW